ncbi:FADD protein, partial [Polyodon spathula]|nr:FADD protein [Polyodon spathula]
WEFLGLLCQISGSLDSENLKNLKFLCGDDIRKKELENISNGTDLFKNLMEKGKISADNAGFLRLLLTNIKRKDLLEKLDNFEKYGSGEQDDVPDVKKRGFSTQGKATYNMRKWNETSRLQPHKNNSIHDS